MELYIEKEFLDYFDIDYSQKPIQEIVKKMIIDYGKKRVFINFKSEDFKNLENESEFFSLIGSKDKAPWPVKSIKEHLFSKSDFKQTIVFTYKKEAWFEEAENKGALCFSFDNYQEKIKEIIEQLHFKKDLSENFDGWDILQKFKVLNFNSIVVSDNYILSHEMNKGIKDNIISLLQEIIYKKDRKINIKIFTKVIVPLEKLRNLTDEIKEAKKKEKAKNIHQFLNSFFANYETNFSIICNDHKPFEYRFHDRYITTNFSLMDGTGGFNLIPYKKSDVQIISETIFDKYTYDRLKSINNIQQKYLKKMQNLETREFKMFPAKK